MPRPLAIALFLAVALGLIGGIHYYLYARLIRDTGLTAPWRTVAVVSLWLLAASMPAAMILGRALGTRVGKLLAWPAYLWMGTMALLAVVVLASDGVRLLAWLLHHARGGGPLDPERRLLFRRVIGGAAAFTGAALASLAVRRALSPLVVKEVQVALPRLPAALDGMTVVQISDIHVGPTIGRPFVEEIVAKVNALDADVVAITGDLVDGSVDELRHAVAPLAGLRARRGVFFVTGNHEYYAGADVWLAELRRLGIRPLRNERVSIGDEAASFDLAGVDDWSSRGQAPGHGPDLPRALAGRDLSRELVLLAHQPKAIHEAAAHGVGLQLSGHTHAGQLWPWNLLVRLQQPYVVGLVREGGTQLYVSPGTGYWGPPMRLGSTAEITRVVLRARLA